MLCLQIRYFKQKKYFLKVKAILKITYSPAWCGSVGWTFLSLSFSLPYPLSKNEQIKFKKIKIKIWIWSIHLFTCFLLKIRLKNLYQNEYMYIKMSNNFWRYVKMLLNVPLHTGIFIIKQKCYYLWNCDTVFNIKNKMTVVTKFTAQFHRVNALFL